jgi:hypothetical protein
MTAGLLNMIDTPKQGNRRPDGVRWCADNGVFGKGYPGDEKWWAWLKRTLSTRHVRVRGCSRRRG